MKSILDCAYGTADAQRLDVHLPECDHFSVFLYFHGGGLETGDKAHQQRLFAGLTARGIAVVSANYRMYPSAAYPDFIDDAAAATAWVVAHMASYGTVDGIFVGGSSAGAYLSMMLCFDGRWLKKYGVSPRAISGFVHDAGQPTCHFRVLTARGVDPRRVQIDDSAPLYHVGAESTYPPMLFLVSDNDMANRYEQTMLLLSTLRNFGHTAPEVQLTVMHGEHCAYVDATDADGKSIFAKIIGNFIQMHEICR